MLTIDRHPIVGSAFASSVSLNACHPKFWTEGKLSDLELLEVVVQPRTPPSLDHHQERFQLADARMGLRHLLEPQPDSAGLTAWR